MTDLRYSHSSHEQQQHNDQNHHHHHHHHHHDDGGEFVTEVGAADDIAHRLLVAKVGAMLALGVASFACGAAPLAVSRCFGGMKGTGAATADATRNGAGTHRLLVSLLLCFGGGVLLYTAFVHLQPEVRHSFAALHLQDRLPESLAAAGVPLSDLAFCAGFFLVYLVEELAHALLLAARADGQDEGTGGGGGSGGGGGGGGDRRSEAAAENAALRRSLSARWRARASSVSIPRVTLGVGGGGRVEPARDEAPPPPAQETRAAAVPTQNHHHHDHHAYGGLLAVLALSFHAVFEGLAVGLEDGVARVWYLAAAVATHKLVIAFCVGVELLASAPRTRARLVLLYVGTFAAVTPAGIAAGLALSATGGSPAESATAAILQALAAGTLLYVVFLEVLARERDNAHTGLGQLLAIVAGFTLMLCLQIATGHEH